MDKQSIINVTSKRFVDSEINCSQSIVYAALVALKKPESEYMVIARAFGGGIAGLKQTCGFITGAAIAYTMIMDPNSQQFKDRIQHVATLVENTANSTQCSTIVEPYEFASKERKSACNAILLIVLDYILDDFIK